MRKALPLLVLLAFSSCVTMKIGVRGADDGYNKAPEGSFAAYMEDSVSTYPFAPSAPVSLMEVNSEALLKLIGQYDAYWVVYWSSWCAHAEDQLPAYLKLSQEHGIPLALVSTNYKTRALNRSLERYGFTGTAFIISAPQYESNEKEKFLTFRKELTGTGDSVFALPYHDLFKKGQFVASEKGLLTEEELIQKLDLSE